MDNAGKPKGDEDIWKKEKIRWPQIDLSWLVHVQADQGIDLAVLQWQVFGMFDGERILSPAIQLALIKFSPAKLTELSPGRPYSKNREFKKLFEAIVRFYPCQITMKMPLKSDWHPITNPIPKNIINIPIKQKIIITINQKLIKTHTHPKHIPLEKKKAPPPSSIRTSSHWRS